MEKKKKKFNLDLFFKIQLIVKQINSEMAKLMQVIIKLLTAIFNSLWTFPPQTPQSDRGQRDFFLCFMLVVQIYEFAVFKSVQTWYGANQ